MKNRFLAIVLLTFSLNAFAQENPSDPQPVKKPAKKTAPVAKKKDTGKIENPLPSKEEKPSNEVKLDKKKDEVQLPPQPKEKEVKLEKEPTVLEKTQQKAEEAYEYGKEKAGEAAAELAKTRAARTTSSFTGLVNYSFLETWVPGKWGGTIGYIRSPASTYELQYDRNSIGFGAYGLDLAEITEQRFSLNWRWFGRRNSFSLVTGLDYTMLKATLGSEYLSTVSVGQVGSYDALEIDSLGIGFGMGNRWQTAGGFTWGIDWFTVHLPVVITKSEAPFLSATGSEDKHDYVSSTLKLFKHLPTFAVFKLQAGFTF